MMPGSCLMNGGCTALVPDVCKTPGPGTPPVPFQNKSLVPMSLNFSTMVKFMSMPALHKMSEQPMSLGDEAGAVGGVVSGMIKGKVAYAMGSNTVKIENKPAVFQTSLTQHNGPNPNTPMGMQDLQSQAAVKIGF